MTEKTAREVIAEKTEWINGITEWASAADIPDDILAALDAAGFQIVPKRLTSEMRRAFAPEEGIYENWRAMLAAAPK